MKLLRDIEPADHLLPIGIESVFLHAYQKAVIDSL